MRKQIKAIFKSYSNGFDVSFKFDHHNVTIRNIWLDRSIILHKDWEFISQILQK